MRVNNFIKWDSGIIQNSSFHRNLTLIVSYIPPLTNLSPHNHIEPQMGICLSNEFMFSANHTQRNLHPDDAYIIGSNVQHSAVNTSHKGAYGVDIKFYDECIGDHEPLYLKLDAGYENQYIKITKVFGDDLKYSIAELAHYHYLIAGVGTADDADYDIDHGYQMFNIQDNPNIVSYALSGQAALLIQVKEDVFHTGGGL
ncbi:hypothetical protein [Paenibacillus tepidiphilus]|uniref:hypothetical protein n=1 Tax=Paenibacillus tepidiphilus TaxID=2608683 RepID=UPI00123C53CF|nr:hypothetical protein [Paenibacillus tepidiphilus]